MSTELAEDTVDGYTDTLPLTNHRREEDMFENSEEFSEEYQGLPDPDHLETVMDGMADSITGNEGLTYAQHYVHSCLQTSGMISSRTGTEGFFEFVGNGLKATWEYICKMFKSIWDFFFGGSEESEKKAEKKAEEQVEKDTALIKETIAPANIPEVAKKVVQKAEKQAKAAKNSGDEHKANAVAELLQTNLKEGKSLTQADLIHAVQELISADSEGKKKLEEAIKGFKEANNAFEKKLTLPRSKGVKTNLTASLWSKMLDDLETPGKHLETVVKALREEITTPAQALELQKQLKVCLDSKGKVSDVIAHHKTEIQKVFNDLKSKVNQAGNETNNELADDVAACNKLITLVASVSKMSNNVHEHVKVVSKANSHLVAA